MHSRNILKAGRWARRTNYNNKANNFFEFLFGKKDSCGNTSVENLDEKYTRIRKRNKEIEIENNLQVIGILKGHGFDNYILLENDLFMLTRDTFEDYCVRYKHGKFKIPWVEKEFKKDVHSAIQYYHNRTNEIIKQEEINKKMRTEKEKAYGIENLVSNVIKTYGEYDILLQNGNIGLCRINDDSFKWKNGCFIVCLIHHDVAEPLATLSEDSTHKYLVDAFEYYSKKVEEFKKYEAK